MAVGGLLLGIIAIFLPPLAVVLRRGCGVDLVINIVLLFLAWIPGVLHAWYIIIKYPGHSERRRMAHRDQHGRSRSRSRSTGRTSYERNPRTVSPTPRYGNGRPPMGQYPTQHVHQQQTGYMPPPKY